MINTTQFRNSLIKELPNFNLDRIDNAIKLILDSKKRDFTTLMKGLKLQKKEDNCFTLEQMRNALENYNDLVPDRNKTGISYIYY